MTNEYRIKHVVGLGYFAQIYKPEKSFFFHKDDWGTIGRHPNGFGIYNEDHTDYPLTRDDACILMTDYLCKPKKGEIDYEEFKSDE